MQTKCLHPKALETLGLRGFFVVQTGFLHTCEFMSTLFFFSPVHREVSALSYLIVFINIYINIYNNINVIRANNLVKKCRQMCLHCLHFFCIYSCCRSEFPPTIIFFEPGLFRACLNFDQLTVEQCLDNVGFIRSIEFPDTRRNISPPNPFFLLAG